MIPSSAYVKRASQMFLLGVSAEARSRHQDSSKLLEKVASAAPRLQEQAEKAVLGTCLFIDALTSRLNGQAA
jgi:hypothetical protein